MIKFKEKPKPRFYAVILTKWSRSGQVSTKAICKAIDERTAIGQVRVLIRAGWRVVNVIEGESLQTFLGDEPMTPKQVSNKRTELMQLRYKREHAQRVEQLREQRLAEQREFKRRLEAKKAERTAKTGESGSDEAA